MNPRDIPTEAFHASGAEVQALDFGMMPDEVAIWFGVLVLIVVGIGLTCPPIGLNVFVIGSIARNVYIAAGNQQAFPNLLC